MSLVGKRVGFSFGYSRSDISDFRLDGTRLYPSVNATLTLLSVIVHQNQFVVCWSIR